MSRSPTTMDPNTLLGTARRSGGLGIRCLATKPSLIEERIQWAVHRRETYG